MNEALRARFLRNQLSSRDLHELALAAWASGAVVGNALQVRGTCKIGLGRWEGEVGFGTPSGSGGTRLNRAEWEKF